MKRIAYMIGGLLGVSAMGGTAVALPPALCPFEKMTTAEAMTGVGSSFGYAVAVEGARIAVAWPSSSGGGRIVMFDVVGDDTVYAGQIIGGGDYFGGSDAGVDNALAMHGDRIVVGDPLDDEGGSNFGAVSVYDCVDGVWTEQAKILGDESFSALGKGVALCGDRFATFDAGDVRIFEKRGADWIETATLPGPNGIFSFGRALALEGDRLLIGAHSADVIGDASGAAYVYEYDAKIDQWVETAALLPGDLAPDDHLGWDVDLDGDVAVVGAAQADIDGVGDAGAVYVFRQIGDAWVEETKVEPLDPDPSGRFGSAVSISGDRLVVGAWLYGGSISGRAIMFERDDRGVWAGAVLEPRTDFGHDDWFGNAVAVAGEIVVVGAPEASEEPIFDRGVVYVYRASDGETDCNDNGAADACDIASGASRDCDGDGIPDECAIADGTLSDCDGDGIADACDFDTRDYRIDDGMPEAAYSAGQLISEGPAVDAVWLNAFTVAPGQERIGGLAISWWYWVPPASLEWPATLLVYDDPNDDGDPSDAVLLRAVDVTARQTDEGGFIDYPIVPPVDVGDPGDVFFAGVFLYEDNDVLEYFNPLATDLGPPFGTSSWLAVASAGTVDLEALDDCDLLAPARMDQCVDCEGNWLLRALPAESCCSADLDGDGTVGFSDLVDLLAEWGPCVACAADLDGDGMVGFTDLVALLADWGPCA